ncbi:UDP-3-O-acyl-N-acetylglucosamine deacetylase [Histidinibacterium aquaticum]|uniref:UDP-3-O-acyl-N-acetylglucosamine deacetylase n=1 Tax=Histidinibacterium aquaticum TaxID=2613962 RepID=A0A5J5GJJ9_9RHOB|nr:UDP-3-O-acyl-N-acetylglucosamine deacetylase [Histidinibacterium aquaticum]KAA9007923.1 UDP-3-O-acyl-N-acetylglucosamine deacetylase [Histidinibacterium aquaticum]
MQTTLANSVTVQGIGLHTGAPVRMDVYPARAGQGIVFQRSDLGGAAVPARWDLVEHSPLMTRLVGHDGTSVSTVEHVMAALAGCGIRNARIVLDGPEAPIADGSAAPFVRRFLAAGIARQDRALTAIRVKRTVEVRRGDAVARLSPFEGLEIDFTIDFDDAAIGHQARRLDMRNGAFLRELCDARTFCRSADVEAMRAQGRALGGTLENAVVVEGDRILTPGGLRHADEAVRHKMLDALGDLALAGAPLLARYTGERAGHAMTNQVLRALFADADNWERVTCPPHIAARLPGAGVVAADLQAVA